MKNFDVAAVVTGGASGLGEATVRALAAKGAAVTILDVQDEKGQALAGELGGHTTFVHTDVTDEGLRYLAASPLMPRLTLLGLSGTDVTSAGLRVLTDYEGPHQLMDLFAFHTILERETLDLLKNRFGSHVVHAVSTNGR